MTNLEMSEDELFVLHEALACLLDGGKQEATDELLQQARVAYDRVHRVLAWGASGRERIDR